MKLTQQKQIWLVLLYSMIEMDGGGPRKKVLQHIEKNRYWYKNDENDISRSSRNEKIWRNAFSYERQHLAEKGYMQYNDQGRWEMTQKGKEYLNKLIDALENTSFESNFCFTAKFYQKLFQTELDTEIAKDQMLIEELSEMEVIEDDSPIILRNEPIPKGRGMVHSRSKKTYSRNKEVSLRALRRAGNRCEIEKSHPSFLRKNSTCLYMEPHHLIPISMTDYYNVSLDREQNIFALCSTCHNQIHYGKKEDVKRLIKKLFESRKDELCSILGKTITLEELYQIYEVS